MTLRPGAGASTVPASCPPLPTRRFAAGRTASQAPSQASRERGRRGAHTSPHGRAPHPPSSGVRPGALPAWPRTEPCPSWQHGELPGFEFGSRDGRVGPGQNRSISLPSTGGSQWHERSHPTVTPGSPSGLPRQARSHGPPSLHPDGGEAAPKLSGMMGLGANPTLRVHPSPRNPMPSRTSRDTAVAHKPRWGGSARGGSQQPVPEPPRAAGRRNGEHGVLPTGQQCSLHRPCPVIDSARETSVTLSAKLSSKKQVDLKK